MRAAGRNAFTREDGSDWEGGLTNWEAAAPSHGLRQAGCSPWELAPVWISMFLLGMSILGSQILTHGVGAGIFISILFTTFCSFKHHLAVLKIIREDSETYNGVGNLPHTLIQSQHHPLTVLGVISEHF